MDLTGPRAKLSWALQHLKLLDTECRGILKTKPFHVAPEFDQDSGCHILRLRIREDAFSLEQSLKVGDIIHNGRSALDQAVWLIACRSNPIEKLWDHKVGRNISFPVVREEEDFPGHRVMPFIADDAKTVLDSLQPYKGGGMAEAMRDLDTLWRSPRSRP